MLCSRKISTMLKVRLRKMMVPAAMLYDMGDSSGDKRSGKKDGRSGNEDGMLSTAQSKTGKVRKKAIRETTGVGELEAKL